MTTQDEYYVDGDKCWNCCLWCDGLNNHYCPVSGRTWKTIDEIKQDDVCDHYDVKEE